MLPTHSSRCYGKWYSVNLTPGSRCSEGRKEGETELLRGFLPFYSNGWARGGSEEERSSHCPLRLPPPRCWSGSSAAQRRPWLWPRPAASPAGCFSLGTSSLGTSGTCTQGTSLLRNRSMLHCFRSFLGAESFTVAHTQADSCNLKDFRTPSNGRTNSVDPQSKLPSTARTEIWIWFKFNPISETSVITYWQCQSTVAITDSCDLPSNF